MGCSEKLVRSIAVLTDGEQMKSSMIQSVSQAGHWKNGGGVRRRARCAHCLRT